jgi:DNA-binding beta-propeller fold protein YncE
LGALAACTTALATAAPTRAAADDPLFILDIRKTFEEAPKPPLPPPRLPSAFEDPCGLAADVEGTLYVSDYYNHVIDLFHFPFPLTTLPPEFPGYITQLKKVDPLDGPCGLAFDAAGSLFVNNYHRNVEKFVPSIFPPTSSTTYASAGIIDPNHPTGVAVDPVSGNLYSNERDRIAVYDSAGAELPPIGAGGSLTDGYGLALSLFPTTLGRLYVPDAATNTLEVYAPALDAEDPIQVIDGDETPEGSFVSLRDAAVAVDNTSGEIYLADNLQPRYTERPETVIYVFDHSGAYEGRLKFSVINGSPPGLTVDNSSTPTQGRVYVTSGNTENAVVYAYPPGAATSASVPLSVPASLPVEEGLGPNGGASTLATSSVAPVKAAATPGAAAGEYTTSSSRRHGGRRYLTSHGPRARQRHRQTRRAER